MGTITKDGDAFFDLIRKRKSVREYLKKDIDLPLIELLKEALFCAPSSRNLKPWEFIIVDNRKKIELLSLSKKSGSSFLSQAGLCIVICADDSISDVWIEDCSVVSTYILLAAQSLGLGSCWIQIRNRMHNANISSEDYVRRILQIPGNIKVESIISLGFPAVGIDFMREIESRENKIHLNSF